MGFHLCPRALLFGSLPGPFFINGQICPLASSSKLRLDPPLSAIKVEEKEREEEGIRAREEDDDGRREEEEEEEKRIIAPTTTTSERDIGPLTYGQFALICLGGGVLFGVLCTWTVLSCLFYFRRCRRPPSGEF